MSLLEAYQALVDRKLAVRRDAGNLSLFKYSKRVFFDNLWGEDPLLLECRGHVIDRDTDQYVVRPFKKVFNYLEQDAGRELTPDSVINIVRKVNGFMAAATLHNGTPLITTTGSFDSDFVKLAQNWITDEVVDALRVAMVDWGWQLGSSTALFEVVDPTDPHIIAEQHGLYLIGLRDNATGRMAPESFVDAIAAQAGLLRFVVKQTTRAKLDELVNTEQHEGYMVLDPVTGEVICKRKSKYYSQIKFLGRTKRYFLTDQINRSALRQKVDEEYYHLVDWIFDECGVDSFLEMPSEDRIVALRDRIV